MKGESVERSPLKKVSYGVRVVFLHCAGVLGMDAVKPLARLLDERGLHPSPAKGGEPLYAAPDTDALVERNFTDYEARYGRTLPKGFPPCQSVAFPLIMEEFPPPGAHGMFSWQLDQDRHRTVELGAWVYEGSQARVMQRRLGDCFLEVARQLYLLARPVFGFVCDPDVDADPWPYERTASERRLTGPGWVAFFDPGYVDKYGRELLAGIPGYRVEDLPDGGLLYQSRPSVLVEDEAAYKLWQQSVCEYLLAHGIRVEFVPKLM